MIYITLLIFLSYIIPVICKYGLPTSISATYYTDIGKIWFAGTMILMGLTLLPSLLDTYPHFLSFWACALLCFVGAIPYSDKIMHHVLAISSGVISQLIILLVNPWILLGWLLTIPIYLFSKKYCLFFIEVWCILSIFILVMI